VEQHGARILRRDGFGCDTRRREIARLSATVGSAPKRYLVPAWRELYGFFRTSPNAGTLDRVDELIEGGVVRLTGGRFPCPRRWETDPPSPVEI
jgi:hypothetical protein